MLTDLEPHLPFLNFPKYTEFLPCSQVGLPGALTLQSPAALKDRKPSVT